MSNVVIKLFIFFGTDTFSIGVLEALKEKGFVPACIVTMPDRKAGRHLQLTPPPIKEWAQKNSIPVLQPERIDNVFLADIKAISASFFVVASYGKIIPQSLLNIPPLGTLNVHPSHLPLLRGATPIETALLHDIKDTGVSIMILDEKMDHGPILGYDPLKEDELTDGWPPTYTELETILANKGGALLGELIPQWTTGQIQPHDQDHTHATYTKKIKKKDAEINFNDNDYVNFLKIQAFEVWPRAFYFHEHNGKHMRIIITKAHLDKNGKLIIDRIIPEGKKEVAYSDFVRNVT